MLNTINLVRFSFLILLNCIFCCKQKIKNPDSTVNPEVISRPSFSTVLQNLTHLKTGEELKIIIQADELLSDTSTLQIKVNEIPIAVESDGLKSTAVYVQKVNGPHGEHEIPITVLHSNLQRTKIDSHTVKYYIDR